MRLRLFAILVLTIVLFLALSTSCNSRSVGPKREIQKDIDIIGLFRGLKEGDDPVIIHIYNLDTGIEHGKISVPGKNGPFEMGIGSPEEGQVYTLIAEAQGYSVQPESYKIRILGDRAYFVSNNETGEKVLILDFYFVPESPPAPLPPGPGTPGAANDDIVSAPGGFTYRARIHQQGQPDWPPVQGSETALSTPLGYIGIGYRSYIETLAGETRNNIIYLDANNAPEIADP
ncbi:MAG: hypothetical protein ABIH70_00690, partial [Chloroflexota bacterium]